MLAIASLAASLVASLAADALTVGQPAPAFTPEKFIKGAEVGRLEPGRVYVIEFWATWCPPCVASMPHLTELQKKNKDITIIGVAGFERAADAAGQEAKVREFLKKRGTGVGITIAMDTDGSMSRDWMQAARQRGIPCSFVVGKDGKVAYIGPPSAALDGAIQAARAAATPPAPDAPAPGSPEAPSSPKP